MEKEFKEYKLSNENGLLIIEDIHSLLKDTYWAAGISKETIKKSIEGSINFGVYLNNKQVGFARIITDQATFAWICDVIIDQSHRGKGLSKQLMAMMMWYLEEKSYGVFVWPPKMHINFMNNSDFKLLINPKCG